jgi:hypothetical protein
MFNFKNQGHYSTLQCYDDSSIVFKKNLLMFNFKNQGHYSTLQCYDDSSIVFKKKF